jgi:ribosome-associated translation inhibitor RaiA
MPMEIRVSSPGHPLTDDEKDRLRSDLEKIERRLGTYKEVVADVRINGNGNSPEGYRVTLEVARGRSHLIASAAHTDLGQAVRSAREDILRQINDRSRRGHSSFAKGT